MSLINKLQAEVDRQFPDLHGVALGDITIHNKAYVALNTTSDVVFEGFELRGDIRAIVEGKIKLGLLNMRDLIDETLEKHDATKS